MIDAIHLAGYVVVGVVAAAVVMNLGLLTSPAVEQSNDVGERFSLIFGIDRSKQHPANVPELTLGIANGCLCQATISVADRDGFISLRTSNNAQRQGQQTPTHQ